MPDPKEPTKEERHKLISDLAKAEIEDGTYWPDPTQEELKAEIARLKLERDKWRDAARLMGVTAVGVALPERKYERTDCGCLTPQTRS